MIFLSSVDADREWLDRLKTHLRPAVRQGQITIWDDSKIEEGSDWAKEIRSAVNRAHMAILLISADYLASDFIQNQEVPLLLDRRSNEGLFVLPIIVRPCAWELVDWLKGLQVLPKGGRPLSDFPNPDEPLAEIAQITLGTSEIVMVERESIPDEGETTTPGEASSQPTALQDRLVFICHASDDGDFAELLKLRLDKKGFQAWIDVNRLSVGVDWRNGIDEAIQNSVALIVVMTPEARESEYVTYEWAFATGNGLKIIPIMLKLTQLHPRLESLQYLDFTNRRARPWSKLIKELEGAVTHRD